MRCVTRRGDQQAQEELGGFPGRYAYVPVPIDRPERERDVRSQCAIEGQRAHRVAPERQEPAPPCPMVASEMSPKA